jgi:SulP family sulfate permease
VDARADRALAAVRAFGRSIAPERKSIGRDALAGVPGAIGSVPDGMASGVLVGVSPIHGLYASFAGPIAGGLASSTRLMVITTTTAAALAAGSALSDVRPAERPGALIMLTLIAGALMVVAGLLRLGRLTRFVSISVMLGFLTGVAANIVCGQIPDLTGGPSSGPFALARALNVIRHPSAIQWQSLVVGVLALALMTVLAWTPLATFSSIIALVVPSLLAIGLADVAQVDDSGSIPTGVPLPHLPDPRDLSFGVITGAFAVAVIVLVQGAGISESVPNRDGTRAEPNRDFVAQGCGNLASCLFRGLPVGASVGSTALNVAAGARTRWAGIFSGIWTLAILVAFSGIVGKIAIPTLAAILIYAAVKSVRTGELRSVWKSGPNSQIGLATTFLATLFLPVSAAVGIGVALSLLLQLNRDALDLRLVEIVPQPDGRLLERPAPRRLQSGIVTALDIYGSLFYAGAKTLEARLPEPDGAVSPVVILRLRGRPSLGATGFAVLERYAARLAAAHGRLYLSGADPVLATQFRRTGRIRPDGSLHILEATPIIGESTMQAFADAEAWLARTGP